MVYSRGIAPVAVVARVLVVGGQHLQLLDQRADGLLADAVGEIREGFVVQAFLGVAIGEALDDLGHALRRHGADGQAVGAGVVGPLAPDDQLEVRHAPPADVAADAQEAEVGDVVLAARVEAAAGLDVQVLGVRIAVDAGRPKVFRQARRPGPATTRCPACRCRCRGRR